jgi:hypothetical protein
MEVTVRHQVAASPARAVLHRLRFTFAGPGIFATFSSRWALYQHLVVEWGDLLLGARDSLVVFVADLEGTLARDAVYEVDVGSTLQLRIPLDVFEPPLRAALTDLIAPSEEPVGPAAPPGGPAAPPGGPAAPKGQTK